MIIVPRTLLLIFTNKGRVYWLKIYSIRAATTGKGKHISNLIICSRTKGHGVPAGEGFVAGNSS